MISGLVVYLTEDDAGAKLALASLRSDPRIELGVAKDPRRVPAVLETTEDGEDAVRGLESIAGVERVEVAFIGLDDSEECNENVVGRSCI